MISWACDLQFSCYSLELGSLNFSFFDLPFQLEMMKDRPRPFINKVEDKDILPFEKIKEQRMRERMARLERARRAVELRRYSPIHIHCVDLTVTACLHRRVLF